MAGFANWMQNLRRVAGKAGPVPGLRIPPTGHTPDAADTIGSTGPTPPSFGDLSSSARGAALRQRKKGAGKSVLTDLPESSLAPVPARLERKTLLGSTGPGTVGGY